MLQHSPRCTPQAAETRPADSSRSNLWLVINATGQPERFPREQMGVMPRSRSRLSANTYLEGTWEASWGPRARPWACRRALRVCPGVRQGAVSTGTGPSPTPPASPTNDHRAMAPRPSAVPSRQRSSSQNGAPAFSQSKESQGFLKPRAVF